MSLSRLTDIFRAVFDNPGLTLTPELTARDVPNWDSYNHIILFSALEEDFGIAFSTEEIVAVASVGELVDLLNRRGADIRW